MMFHISVCCLVLVAVKSACAIDESYMCYRWTDEDFAAMESDKGKRGVRRSDQCESYPGNVYTGGYNLNYPNCGDCWCCHSNTFGWRIPEGNRKVWCERRHGNIFTEGFNKKYPNCDDCWCCQPERSRNIEFDNYLSQINS